MLVILVYHHFYSGLNRTLYLFSVLQVLFLILDARTFVLAFQITLEGETTQRLG